MISNRTPHYPKHTIKKQCTPHKNKINKCKYNPKAQTKSAQLKFMFELMCLFSYVVFDFDVGNMWGSFCDNVGIGRE